jgi:DNA-binding helix-hairpin-helix protein with protein kinase domain
MSGRTVFLDGKSVTLAELPLKGGGQAAVFPVEGDHGTVVKLYRDPPGPEQERRLTRMLTMSPLAARPTDRSQPPELAWPTAIARGQQGEFLGYAMHRFGEPQHVQLVGLFTRAQRLKLFPDRADWRFMLGVSWNLAFMTARMHYDNLVIGDFSSSNVVVDANGFVTFLDCDSIAFTDPVTGEPFPCLMHTTDYSSPERQAGGPATRASDDFALAVLVYQLLTAGNHPFGGVPHDSTSESTVKDNIAASCSYVVRPEVVTIPRGTIDPSVLPPELLTLARASFGPGVHTPTARPPAEAWLRALDKERAQVQACRNRPLHTYASHLPTCPWCARTAITGHDVFNGPVPVRTPVAPQAEAKQEQRQEWPTPLKIALLVAAVVLLVIILAAKG